MNIDDIIKDVTLEIEKIAEESESEKLQPEVDVSPESIDKLASFLETHSEEDTLIDDLAKFAVLNDRVAAKIMLNKSKGGKHD